MFFTIVPRLKGTSFVPHSMPSGYHVVLRWCLTQQPSYSFNALWTRLYSKGTIQCFGAPLEVLEQVAGFEPTSAGWKTTVLTTTLYLHGGKRYFTFYTAPLPVPAVNLSWSLVDYSPHSQDSGIPACFLFKSLRHTYTVSSHLSWSTTDAVTICAAKPIL